jgi:hypothetical protein
LAKVYRAMLSDGEYPQTGEDDAMLGVRIPPHPRYDVVPVNGIIQPDTGGMSVVPEISKLPGRLIPQRLQHLYPKAVGDDDLSVWSSGDGPFTDGSFATGLTLRVDKHKKRHGVIEPETPMPAEQFQAALYATAPNWKQEG